MSQPMISHDLFSPDLPSGFHYDPAFLSEAEAGVLTQVISQLSFDPYEMRGVVARRRVKFYGATYGGWAATPMPAFLEPLRAKVARWADVEPEAFVMALVNEYRPGATIGWHRDAMEYAVTAGVSLGSACRMKLRPFVEPKDRAGRRAPRKTTHELTLGPRSGYLITGVARDDYEHSIPPTPGLRYSITFRTRR